MITICNTLVLRCKHQNFGTELSCVIHRTLILLKVKNYEAKYYVIICIFL